MSTSAFSQSWKKKPFTKWSMSEVTQILTDSPWAQTQVADVHVNYGLPANSYAATIRLRSALPVREALLRQKQLTMNYDKFTPADKARFDKETEQFLQCSDCVKYYIVTLGSPVFSYDGYIFNEESYVFDIIGTLKNLTLDELKKNIYLANDEGDRREIVHFIPPAAEGKEAMFVFSRLDSQGKPLITPKHKHLYFKIEEKLFTGRSVPLKRFAFDVPRLIQNGQIAF